LDGHHHAGSGNSQTPKKVIGGGVFFTLCHCNTFVRFCRTFACHAVLGGFIIIRVGPHQVRGIHVFRSCARGVDVELKNQSRLDGSDTCVTRYLNPFHRVHHVISARSQVRRSETVDVRCVDLGPLAKYCFLGYKINAQPVKNVVAAGHYFVSQMSTRPWRKGAWGVSRCLRQFLVFYFGDFALANSSCEY
jgi:hypothetical protein